MPTEVGTHDKLQQDSICCWLPTRCEKVFLLLVAVDPGLRRITVGWVRLDRRTSKVR